ncbi:hypothetical protein BDD43_2921 [Mucilaginibacter gracilis]|uniref:Uncharacterized protein n=1 Tax=Mucilaginibacter gracilis TaxID=423350 RepID=A0A495J168_9SPHI|nr:hypothetical protein [Mucilaginibacter gracilis]RKR82736.1 hypothetical protein BDD43_2921 [Mucilaginibacter gracilis]
MNNLLVLVETQENSSSVAPIVVIIVTTIMFVALVVRVCWPSLRENNIFQKTRLYNYGRGPEAKAYVRQRQRDTIAFCAGSNIAGLILLIFKSIQPKVTNPKYPVNALSGLPLRFFLLGLFCTICLLIFSFVEEVEHSLVRNFKFSLKVWVTSLFISPLLLVIVFSYRFTNIGYMFYVYLRTVVTISGVGSITFAALTFATHYFTVKPFKTRGKRLCILLATQFTMLFNIIFAMALFNPDISWLVGWLFFTVIMGLCIKYYSMDTTVYTEAVFYEAEVID